MRYGLGLLRYVLFQNVQPTLDPIAKCPRRFAPRGSEFRGRKTGKGKLYRDFLYFRVQTDPFLGQNHGLQGRFQALPEIREGLPKSGSLLRSNCTSPKANLAAEATQRHDWQAFRTEGKLNLIAFFAVIDR